MAPHAQYVARKGQINSWDNPDFVAAVKRPVKTINYCRYYHQRLYGIPAISAIAEGYQVFVVIDASGTYSKMAQEITLARVVRAGAVPMDTAAVCSEIQHLESSGCGKWAKRMKQCSPNINIESC